MLECVIVLGWFAAGPIEVNDETVSDLLVATMFEPCTDGHRGVRISPPSCWEEVSREQLLRRQPQHLQQMVSTAFTSTSTPAPELVGNSDIALLHALSQGLF